jgi:hypothetical protein
MLITANSVVATILRHFIGASIGWETGTKSIPLAITLYHRGL